MEFDEAGARSRRYRATHALTVARGAKSPWRVDSIRRKQIGRVRCSFFPSWIQQRAWRTRNMRARYVRARDRCTEYRAEEPARSDPAKMASFLLLQGTGGEGAEG